jgi:hypothetical protein
MHISPLAAQHHILVSCGLRVTLSVLEGSGQVVVGVGGQPVQLAKKDNTVKQHIRTKIFISPPSFAYSYDGSQENIPKTWKLGIT